MEPLDEDAFLSACESTIKDRDSGYYPLRREECIRLLEIAKSAAELRAAAMDVMADEYWKRRLESAVLGIGVATPYGQIPLALARALAKFRGQS